MNGGVVRASMMIPTSRSGVARTAVLLHHRGGVAFSDQLPEKIVHGLAHEGRVVPRTR
jgi:hypothetical protein